MFKYKNVGIHSLAWQKPSIYDEAWFKAFSYCIHTQIRLNQLRLSTIQSLCRHKFQPSSIPTPENSTSEHRTSGQNIRRPHAIPTLRGPSKESSPAAVLHVLLARMFRKAYDLDLQATCMHARMASISTADLTKPRNEAKSQLLVRYTVGTVGRHVSWIKNRLSFSSNIRLSGDMRCCERDESAFAGVVATIIRPGR